MRILSKAFRSRLHPVLRTRAAWWILAVGALLIEITGRRSRNDLDDGFGILALIALVGIATFRREESPLEPLRQAAQRLRGRATAVLRRWFDLEADLRREPPLARGLPREQVTPALVLAGAGAALLALAILRPIELRALFAPNFYLAHLVLLAALWSAILAAGVLAVTVSVALVRDLEEQRQAAPETRAIPAWLLPGAVGAVVAFGFLLVSPLVGVAITAGAWALSALALLAPGGPRLEIAWRPRDGGSRRSADWSRFLLVHLTLLTFPPAVVALLAGGGAVAQGWDAGMFAAMPVTALVSIFLTWVGAGAAIMLALKVLVLVVPARLADPARRIAPGVRIESGSARDAARARRILEEAGFRVRQAPERHRKDDVVIRLVERTPPAAFGVEPAWPLEVTCAQLEAPETLTRLGRRDAVQRRRRFFRGVGKLLKAVPAAGLEEGEGVLFGPQHWFMPTLTVDEGRDRAPDDPLTVRSRSIGPPVSRVMNVAARSHFHQVMTALAIDVIYVEKGVSRRLIVRVLRILFDVHDMHGGTRRLDERDLVGIAGLRAVIHDFAFDEPFRSDVFPEPHHEGVGRARVLHLFRDRGEQDETIEDPIASRDLPMPALVGG